MNNPDADRRNAMRHRFIALPLAALATLLFCAFLALFPAAAAYAYAAVNAPRWAKLPRRPRCCSSAKESV